MVRPVLFFLLFFPARVLACDLALLLAVDISGSVDPSEYAIQMEGLAEGLTDSLVIEALVRSKAAVSVVQWTGASRQELSVPWVRIGTYRDVQSLADKILETPRAWRNFSTAIGEAMRYTAPLFEEVGDCARKVVDISGDGVSNEGISPRQVQDLMRAKGITVNALVIEGVDEDLTAYFWENVITGEGAFVVTANGYSEYPIRMRKKLLREITLQIAGHGKGGPLIPVSARN